MSVNSLPLAYLQNAGTTFVSSSRLEHIGNWGVCVCARLCASVFFFQWDSEGVDRCVGSLTSCWPLGPHPAYCSGAFRTSGGFRLHVSLWRYNTHSVTVCVCLFVSGCVSQTVHKNTWNLPVSYLDCFCNGTINHSETNLANVCLTLRLSTNMEQKADQTELVHNKWPSPWLMLGMVF